MFMFRMTLAIACLTAVSTASQAQQSPAVTDAFKKQTLFGVWSKNIFADAVTVSGSAKTIYLSGMGAEDANTGTILYR